MIEWNSISIFVKPNHQFETRESSTYVRYKPYVQEIWRPMHSDDREEKLHD